jgi:hypothetical protein
VAKVLVEATIASSRAPEPPAPGELGRALALAREAGEQVAPVEVRLAISSG